MVTGVSKISASPIAIVAASDMGTGSAVVAAKAAAARAAPRGVLAPRAALEPRHHLGHHGLGHLALLRVRGHLAVAVSGAHLDAHVLALERLAQPLVDADPVALQQQRSARQTMGKGETAEVDLAQLRLGGGAEDEATDLELALGRRRRVRHALEHLGGLEPGKRLELTGQLAPARGRRPQNEPVDGRARLDGAAGEHPAQAQAHGHDGARARLEPHRTGRRGHRRGPRLEAAGIPGIPAAVTAPGQREAQHREAGPGQAPAPLAQDPVGAHLVPAERRAEHDGRVTGRPLGPVQHAEGRGAVDVEVERLAHVARTWSSRLSAVITADSPRASGSSRRRATVRPAPGSTENASSTGLNPGAEIRTP